MPSTIRLHRVLRAKPERVYRALLDPDAMAKWLPPYGFTCKVQHIDAKVGGTHKASFTKLHYRKKSFIRWAIYRVETDDPNLPGEMQVTVSLKPVSCGTELTIVQEGVPDIIPAEGCYLGWQESLAQLANLVDPEIPD